MNSWAAGRTWDFKTILDWCSYLYLTCSVFGSQKDEHDDLETRNTVMRFVGFISITVNRWKIQRRRNWRKNSLLLLCGVELMWQLSIEFGFFNLHNNGLNGFWDWKTLLEKNKFNSKKKKMLPKMCPLYNLQWFILINLDLICAHSHRSLN